MCVCVGGGGGGSLLLHKNMLKLLTATASSQQFQWASSKCFDKKIKRIKKKYNNYFIPPKCEIFTPQKWSSQECCNTCLVMELLFQEVTEFPMYSNLHSIISNYRTDILDMIWVEFLAMYKPLFSTKNCWYFLISLWTHLLWVLIRGASVRHL